VLPFTPDYLHFSLCQCSSIPALTTLHGRLDLPDLVSLMRSAATCMWCRLPTRNVRRCHTRADSVPFTTGCPRTSTGSIRKGRVTWRFWAGSVRKHDIRKRGQHGFSPPGERLWARCFIKAERVSLLTWCSMPSASDWATCGGTPSDFRNSKTISCRRCDSWANLRPASVRKMER
jgi:hypothetical protein